MSVVRSAIVYFLSVFGFAFVMGVLRVLFVTPALGPTVAVLLELPIVLTASWAVARGLLHRHRFNLPQRATIGGIAFVLTIISEVLLSDAMRGLSVSQWAATLATPLGLIGLAAQLGVALMPTFALRNQSGPEVKRI